jgi:hypothetical protein
MPLDRLGTGGAAAHIKRLTMCPVDRQHCGSNRRPQAALKAPAARQEPEWG